MPLFYPFQQDETISVPWESDRVSIVDVVFVILAFIIKFVLLYGINSFYTVRFPRWYTGKGILSSQTATDHKGDCIKTI